jgi:hypothetical protein
MHGLGIAEGQRPALAKREQVGRQSTAAGQGLLHGLIEPLLLLLCLLQGAVRHCRLARQGRLGMLAGTTHRTGRAGL